MTDDTHTIRGGGLTATIKAHGAELCSLRSDAGIEFVWQAGPAWLRHAPLLFPIVGRLANDELRHRGKTYRITQHGFADWAARAQEAEETKSGPSARPWDREGDGKRSWETLAKPGSSSKP